MASERKRSRFGDADAEPQTQSAAAAAASSTAATGGERVLAIKKKIYPPIVQYPQADFAGLVKRERSRIQGPSPLDGARGKAANSGAKKN